VSGDGRSSLARTQAEPIIAPPFSDLSALPRARLLAMREAERELFDVLTTFAREGRHPVHDVVSKADGAYTTFTRYPEDGVGGGQDNSAWYYHASASLIVSMQPRLHSHCHRALIRLLEGPSTLLRFACDATAYLIGSSRSIDGRPTNGFIQQPM
jgi:hypothetical protein